MFSEFYALVTALRFVGLVYFSPSNNFYLKLKLTF